jgi:H+-translocating NAD(P) transhydrogenase subunit alpha
LLHTPLMSLTNAISGIALVGSIVIVGSSQSVTTTVLGTIAIAASSSNVIGGFLLTDRMLRMFRKRS